MGVIAAVEQRHKTNPYVRVLAKASLCTTLAIGVSAAEIPSSFYTATQREIAGKPGTIIRQESFSGAAPSGASAFRILYRSTGVHSEPIAASAVIVVSAGAVPESGRPIVAWSHPTSGVDQPCAPSLSSSVLQMIQGLPEMLRRGYVVVAPDYPGLGTIGPHPYLVGQGEGRTVLDAVRAARSLPEAHAGNRFALWGHSQGGHASLYAGILARQYAPELSLVGVAVAAPASDLTVLSKADPADSPLMSAMLLWSWSRIFNTPLERVVAAADIPSVQLLAHQCFDPPLDSNIQPSAKSLPTATYRMVRGLAATEPWKSLYVQNTPGALPADVPVFLAQGSADTTIPPSLTVSYRQRLCRAGDTVHMVVMPGVDHRFIARDAASAAVEWISDRFAGRSAPNDCENPSNR